MRIAILYDDSKRVFVEFNPEKFRNLFKEYFKKNKDIDKTFDAIISDLKRETSTK